MIKCNTVETRALEPTREKQDCFEVLGGLKNREKKYSIWLEKESLVWFNLRHRGNLSPSAKQRRNPCSGPPPVYQDLRTRNDWPVKKAIVDLPITMKGNSKRTSGNSLNPLEAQNKDLGASQTSLIGVKFRLGYRLGSVRIIGNFEKPRVREFGILIL